MKVIHLSGGEAAFRRGCSVWSAATSDGFSCRSEQASEGTDYWVWKAARYREKKAAGLVPFIHL